MAEHCPTCGQPLPGSIRIHTAEELVAAMRAPPPAKYGGDRSTVDVYEAYDHGKYPTGRFYLTYSGGEVSREAVEDAARCNLIALSWPNIETGHWSLPEQAAENFRRFKGWTAKHPERRRG